MSAKYVVQRLEQTRGPLTASELRNLAGQGELRPDDLIRPEQDAVWTAARNVKGLFETRPSHETPPAAATVADPTAFRGAAAGRGTMLETLERYRPIAEHYAREYDLGTNHFLAISAGSAGLFVLALSTLLTWERWTMQMGGALPGVGDSTTYSGLDVLEGKLVCLLAVVGVIAFFATVVMKRLLPISLLVAAAVGTCSVLLTLSYKHQIAEYDAEAERVARATAKNYGATFGEAGGKEMSNLLIPRETDTAAWGLYLSLLASLIVTATFLSAALVKPVTLEFLQKDTIHPVARKHGGLLLSQAAAFLIGLADYVLRY